MYSIRIYVPVMMLYNTSYYQRKYIPYYRYIISRIDYNTTYAFQLQQIHYGWFLMIYLDDFLYYFIA